jgi:hypothetical protein
MADARKHRVPQVAAGVWKRRGPPVVADTKAVLREVAEAGTAVVGPPAAAADTTGRIAFP